MNRSINLMSNSRTCRCKYSRSQIEVKELDREYHLRKCHEWMRSWWSMNNNFRLSRTKCWSPSRSRFCHLRPTSLQSKMIKAQARKKKRKSRSSKSVASFKISSSSRLAFKTNYWWTPNSWTSMTANSTITNKNFKLTKKNLPAINKNSIHTRKLSWITYQSSILTKRPSPATSKNLLLTSRASRTISWS